MKFHQINGYLSILMILIFSGTTIMGSAHPVASVNNTDTIIGINFQVNMTRAVEQGIFHPDSDYVYVVLDQGIATMSLVPGPSYTYSALVTNGLDSGVTYNYKFRINDSLWETVNRSVQAMPGITTVKTWWNKEALNYTAFIVNMTYAAQSGQFDPLADSVEILGTMNNWTGSKPMIRIDTTLSYFITYPLDPGSIQQYKFRINSDSSGLELLYKPNRMLRIPDTLLEAVHYFNNYDPASLPMTFNCDMEYYLRAGHFGKLTDYLDVAGSFNGWGADDVLFDNDNDSVYSLVKYLDTAYIHQPPLEFKFRINGSWLTAELEGKPNRTYTFHDTVGQNPNIFNAWYDDKDPHIPTPPWVYDVHIQGHLLNHQVLSGSYTFEDINGRPEDSTTYQWYRSPDSLMSILTPIDTATRITYTVDTLDIGLWLVFEVTPRAAGGDSAVGKPVMAVSISKVGGVGIEESANIISKVYPNPVYSLLNLESVNDLSTVELFNYIGQEVCRVSAGGQKRISIDMSNLPPGFYILKANGKDRATGLVKVIKR